MSDKLLINTEWQANNNKVNCTSQWVVWLSNKQQFQKHNILEALAGNKMLSKSVQTLTTHLRHSYMVVHWSWWKTKYWIWVAMPARRARWMSFGITCALVCWQQLFIVTQSWNHRQGDKVFINIQYMTAPYDNNIWLQYITVPYDNNIWLHHMITIYDCNIWLHHMITIYDCTIW